MKAKAEMVAARKMDVYVLAQQSVGSFKTSEDSLKRFSLCPSLSTSAFVFLRGILFVETYVILNSRT